MTLHRKFSYLAVAGVLIIVSTGGLNVHISNNFVSASMSPWALLAWPFLLASLLSSLQANLKSTETAAPWWRGTVAFLIDAPLVMSIIIIPLCLLILVVESSGLPSSWEIDRRSDSVADLIYAILYVPTFAAVWIGIGMCLHPRITTPGCLVANITLSVQENLPMWRLALLGIFAYYGVFIPLFKIFAPDINVIKVHIAA
jgi:hypothetical protein